MRHAINVPNSGTPGQLLALAEAADAHGWDGFFCWDHLHLTRGGPATPVFDPFVLLGAIATRTSRVRLGTLVTPLPRRRPQKLAKEYVTLDHLSDGRVIVALGLGVPPELEYAAFGEPSSDRDRAERLDEGLAILDPLLRGDRVDVTGAHLEAHTRLAPGTVQTPRPPIWLAGRASRPKPLARALRWDGYFPIGDDGEPLRPEELGELLDAKELPEGFDLVASQADGVDPAAYAAVGVTWLIQSRWPGPGWQDEIRAIIEAGPPT